MRKIGYARVSTADQNPDMQIQALKDYGVSPDLIFTDKASGGTMKRRGFERALKTAQHAGTEFVVWKMDRLGRDLVGILDTLKLLGDRGVHFVSLTERLDTQGPMGKAMVHIIATIAQLERDLIRERTLAGMARARERGDNPGRPKAMTEAREAKAREMLLDGQRGVEVWRALQEIDGPPIGRAAYYRWQKAWDETYAKPDEQSQ
ncbi:recombinase family protein [Maritimibacter sp. 55A14]|uniref:recombinase family protein n=1 Tax=Maritimibacter sp. 55A14 TaxID=2174844 RepID=UPI0021013AC6|nr:recombinase family protein [Maritimibacter sp. 55A14]